MCSICVLCVLYAYCTCVVTFDVEVNNNMSHLRTVPPHVVCDVTPPTAPPHHLVGPVDAWDTGLGSGPGGAIREGQ